MEKESANLFRTCRNYKKGIYIFNLYKRSDFIVLLIAILVGLVILFIGYSDVSTVKSSTYLAALVVGIPAFLTLPLEGYHAMYYRLCYIMKFMARTRYYIRAGREYRFEEYEDEDV